MVDVRFRHRDGNVEPRTANVEPKTLLVLGFLALLVSLAYGNSLRNGFVYDDDYLIVRNGLLTRLDTLPTLLTSDYWITRKNPFGDPPPPTSSGLYRPLVGLSYALNYAMGGVNPIGYHLVNLLLHLLVTWLLYLLVLQLQFPPAAAVSAAALFAIHPLHTEAVTNVVGRAELFMALGVLGSLWLAVTGRRWWSLGAFASGLFSKEQAVMVPFLLLLQDLCLPRASAGQGSGGETPLRDRIRRAISRYGGYLLVLAGYLMIRRAALGELMPPPTPVVDNPLASLDWGPRILTALKVDGLYLRLFFWPASLSLDYSYDAIPAVNALFDPEVLFGLAAWGGLVSWMVWSFVQGDRLVGFSIGFTVLTFLPVSNLVILIGTIMGERLFYLPSAGLCLLAGLAYERATGQQSVVSGQPSASPVTRHWSLLLVVLICLALLGRTVTRNLDWFSNETAFQSAILVVPQSAKINAMMGILAASKQEWGAANESFATALRLYPNYSLTDGELTAKIGAALLAEGEIERALDLLERSVALERDSKVAQYNLGLAYAKAGRYSEAEGPYRRYLTLEPEAAEAFNGLSYVLTKQQRYEEAEAMAVEAIRRRPEFPEAHYNRGRALEGLDSIGEAIAEYERVLELSPTEEGVSARLARLREQRPRSRRPPSKEGETSHEKAAFQAGGATNFSLTRLE